MIQTSLPIFPSEIKLINSRIGFMKRETKVYYFNGSMPIYSHKVEDYKTFRMYTSQLVVDGNATQMEIVRAFGVSEISVKRWVKKYREEGPEGFYKERATRSASVLTP